MPALSSISPLVSVFSREGSLATRSTDKALQVVCAWPLSSEYGVGLRLLFYILVAGSFLGRGSTTSKEISEVCLAGAMLLPAVAAVHAIVLTAVHVDGAVDMDILGAFQLCAIGALAAPVAAKKSQNFIIDPRRGLIFPWTVLLVAGLLSLTAEFYRQSPFPCPFDDTGTPISTDPTKFPYAESPSCDLICNTTAGPFSPMRGGSANNIYVVPAPSLLTFGTAMLLAAGCCVPALLQLISIWLKMVKKSEKTQLEKEGSGLETGRRMELVEKVTGPLMTLFGKANVAITSCFRKANKALLNANPAPGPLIGNQGVRGKVIRAITEFLTMENAIFTCLVLAIIIFGEINLWSRQVTWMIEPMPSIGQWASLAGTGLATFATIYAVAAKEYYAWVESMNGEKLDDGTNNHLDGSRAPSVRDESISRHSSDSENHRGLHDDDEPLDEVHAMPPFSGDASNSNEVEPLADPTDQSGQHSGSSKPLFNLLFSALDPKRAKMSSEDSEEANQKQGYLFVPGEEFSNSQIAAIQRILSSRQGMGELPHIEVLGEDQLPSGSSTTQRPRSHSSTFPANTEAGSSHVHGPDVLPSPDATGLQRNNTLQVPGRVRSRSKSPARSIGR